MKIGDRVKVIDCKTEVNGQSIHTVNVPCSFIGMKGIILTESEIESFWIELEDWPTNVPFLRSELEVINGTI